MELNTQQEEVQRVPTEKETQAYIKNMKKQNDLLKLQSDQWEYTYKILYYKSAVANMEAEIEDARGKALQSMMQQSETDTTLSEETVTDPTPVEEETPA